MLTSSRKALRAAARAQLPVPGTSGSACASTLANYGIQKGLFSKILIANRGEVACRVIRTARKLGVKTVAVYSEADANAMHVKLADEAYLLGPAPSSESYLRMDKLVDLCHKSGAQAVHPGWGFLSERAEFAELLHSEGITFIGPPASAIVSMGSKSESKEIMLAAGVPCVPGYHGPNQSPDFLASEANKIGFPVLIKAIKGGGGKGMKIAFTPEEFGEQLESAKREGEKSFGDGTVLLEKYLLNPRHVEVQVFADKHGTTVHLHERDCSVQRRHQKIIEEAPAPGLSEELRRELGMKAVNAAKAVGYVGAGTVEFIMADGAFYFMEMNTRLQVEHPITEMITGQDLVHWQLLVASGHPLPLTQEQIPRIGHAFETRIYAEVPRKNFLPDVGKLEHVRTPTENASVRVETGAEAGDEISVHYDPMIAKLVVHSTDRDSALALLRTKLHEYQISGPSTNISFLLSLASHPAFVAGDVETGFIDRFRDDLFPVVGVPEREVLERAGVVRALEELKQREEGKGVWSQLKGFRVAGTPATRRYTFTDVPRTSEAAVDVTLLPGGSSTGAFKLSTTAFDGTVSTADVSRSELGGVEGRDLKATIGGVRAPATTHVYLASSSGTDGLSGKMDVFHADDEAVALGIPMPKWLSEVEEGGIGAGEGGVRAPMPSKVVKVGVKVGDVVKEGEAVVVLEAMKTEVVLRAPRDGIVKEVRCQEGGMVKEGEEVVVFEAEASASSGEGAKE